MQFKLRKGLWTGVETGFILLLFCCAEVSASTAKYKVTFDAQWSAETHPTDFPSSPHFSSLIGAAHNEDVSFWELGQIASDGIESMAETGSTTRLRLEVESAIAAGNASAVVIGSGIGLSPDVATTTFEVDRIFPQLTLVTMIAPSPDWFVGVSGLSLMTGGVWRDGFSVDLLPLDAGTDSGTRFEPPLNDDTMPPEPISIITGFPFESTLPLGTFSFELLSTPERPGDVNHDGLISRADLTILVKNFGTPSAARATDGDLNADAMISLLDLAKLSSYLSTPANSPRGVAVPEPGSLSLLFVAATILLGTRCRRIDSRSPSM